MRRVVLITGASSGLGAGMARVLAERGHHLALCARRVDRLEELRAELTAAHPDVVVRLRALDVNDHQAVFDVFEAFDTDFAADGGLSRVVVNAGLGKGAPIGTGRFDANVQTAETNFVAALAQCEAAMQIFRRRGEGHLVVVSSVAAVRGARGATTTYAATKAGVAALAEGIRSDVLGSGIAVTTLLPGFIESEMTARTGRTPWIVDNETGSRAMVDAMDKEVPTAAVPAWPWWPVTVAARVLPLRLVRRLM